MNFILDRLAVGATTDVPQAQEAGITAVLSLCEVAPAPILGMRMCHSPVPDEVFLSSELWSGLTTWLSRHLRKGYTVLVHCRLGVSRSPTLCAAHLIQAGFAPEEALARVQRCRPIAQPHEATWRSMLAWWESQNAYRKGY